MCSVIRNSCDFTTFRCSSARVSCSLRKPTSLVQSARYGDCGHCAWIAQIRSTACCTFSFRGSSSSCRASKARLSSRSVRTRSSAMLGRRYRVSPPARTKLEASAFRLSQRGVRRYEPAESSGGREKPDGVEPRNHGDDRSGRRNGGPTATGHRLRPVRVRREFRADAVDGTPEQDQPAKESDDSAQEVSDFHEQPVGGWSIKLKSGRRFAAGD